MPRSLPVLDSLWRRLLGTLSEKLPASILESWIHPCRLVAVEGDHLTIAAPNSFSRDWLTQHYLDALTSAGRDVIGGEPKVTLVVDDRPAPAVTIATSAPMMPPPRATTRNPEGLNPRYTFDSFVVGSSNQFAQAACQAVAELPSRAYNPLFIYGGVGLGKTHLLHAVGYQAFRLFPGMTVMYLSSERFTNELINAIRYDRTAEFRNRYRTIDLLLIDDIQFISGKERTQEEFFHTFNDLYESRKQIIVSSDCPPKDIPEIEERLRSRFEWGLIADIQPPDFETRVAILKKKAAQERVILADDVAYLIASRIRSNIRELEGSLTRMIAFCALTGREMSVDLAQEVLGELWGEEEKVITIEQIQRKVADFFGVTVTDLKAKNRTKAVALPRQVAMYLARQLTHSSLAEVGRAFGGKDHTTVLHAVEKIGSLLAEDAKLKKSVEGLIQAIKL
ncbi:MAG: chromosomal replication initiator protein DnaA [Candidatus Rokubacteria bacterium]|nr:chromosomal replication initiator protein DnaA [Candidatus Rokubacteria bacterium]